MADKLALQFKNTLASMNSACEAAGQWLTERGASPEIVYLTNLAIEELGTNCMKFGYADDNEHSIDVELSLTANNFVLTFTDDGRPFDPLNAPVPDTTLAAEERTVGGLGIFLLRQMSDRFEYTRDDHHNRVVLVKAITSK